MPRTERVDITDQMRGTTGPKSDYPEHDKLLRVADQSQAIGEFLEWLGDTKQVNLMHWVETDELVPCPGSMLELRDCVDGYVADYFDQTKPSKRKCPRCHGEGQVNQHFEGWVPQPTPVQTLLAEHFGIDLKKIETEKRAMLERMREATL